MRSNDRMMAMAMSNDTDAGGLDPKYRFINDHDKCHNCEDDSPYETSLKCFKCEKLVHALCKDSKGEYSSTNPCTKTFLDSFSKRSEKSVTNSKRIGSFLFICDFCLTADENNRAADLNSRLCLL